MLKAISNLARGIASAVGGSPLSPPRQDFTAALYASEVARHRTILDQQDAGIPRNPPGWSILDDDSPRGRGFLPLPEAARTMGLSEDATLALCGRELAAVQQGSTLLVQPAVVSVLGGGRPVSPPLAGDEAA